jgi:hypothetical protein
MPLSWCISHPCRLVIAVAKGELEPHDMMEFIVAIDAANARSYRKMVDVTGVTMKVSADSIRRLAGLMLRREQESEVGPIGVVAGSPAVHRQAVLFARQAQRYRLIRIFHEQHDARKWLDAIDVPSRAEASGDAYTVRLNAMEIRSALPR